MWMCSTDVFYFQVNIAIQWDDSETQNKYTSLTFCSLSYLISIRFFKIFDEQTPQ